MDKSADAFRTISEVAEHLETPAHVLRFWESRFPQIRPVKRAGGRRYYRPSDVSLLTGIKRLLHDEGMTIRGVQKILREQGVRHVAGLSGDAAEEAGSGDSGYFDQDAALVMPQTAEPVMFRPTPGLAEAMAKAMDHVPSLGSSTALPSREAVQGALLLTPPSEPKDAVVDAAMPPEADLEQDIAAIVQASQHDEVVMAKPATPAVETPAEAFSPASDFEDDDFDEGPIATLASRIRALPAEASIAKVGAELVDVVTRLQALRDRMVDAAGGSRT